MTLQIMISFQLDHCTVDRKVKHRAEKAIDIIEYSGKEAPKEYYQLMGQ